MFSIEQKRHIAEEVQKILRATNHPELPAGEIHFHLHVEGAESWSWADIRNNGDVPNPDVNPWNELISKMPPEVLERRVRKSLAKMAGPRYSGPLSAPFWNRVKHLQDDSDWAMVYALGCALQELEARVLRSLEESEKRGILKKGRY